MTYALEALRTLRAQQEDTAARALADAVRAREEADDAVREAEAAITAHVAETDALLARERSRPLEDVRPSDAAHLQRWRARRRDEMTALRDALARATKAAQEAEGAVTATREALAEARKEREAIERHHAKWRDDERRRAEAREEAESEDRRPR